MTRLSGRYELREELGAGGMARVLAAHDLDLDRPVAVKLLHTRPDGTARQRFLNEARTAARFHHPNAVAIHDAGEHDGQPYIVMELVRGRTLADHLADRGPLPLEEAVAITLGVLDALAAAHGRGLVHRDVKPGNVLLPDEGGVKLADFGIAKALDDATSGVTAPGTIMGTASYVAPELVEGAAVTPASDVYAVGCVLYELLTGSPPFDGDTPLTVAYAHVRTPLPPVADRRRDVPPDLAAVVERALAKDPTQRFPDAAALRTVLLEGPEAAPPPTMPLAGVGTIPGDAPTRALRASSEHEAAERGRRGRGAIIGGAVLAALVLLAAVALGRGWLDGTPGAARLGADEQVEHDAPEPAPGDAEEPEPDDTEEPQASTLSELIALLAAEPGSYGEKQGDLLDKLVELSQEDDPEDRTDDAADLREDVEDWVAAGELDPRIAALADPILAEIAAGAA